MTEFHGDTDAAHRPRRERLAERIREDRLPLDQSRGDPGLVVEAMRLPEAVDREQLLQVLLAREALASTAIGDGVAIPHVRNPIVLHVARPAITLCLLERPVDPLRFPWSIPGGNPSLALDPLSGVFLLPTFVLAAAAAIYGQAYLLAARRMPTPRDVACMN